jgi:GntR family galactonate operon transcriptional repressor
MKDLELIPANKTGSQRPRVHLALTKELAMRILGGEYQPGVSLPNLDDLGRELSVSRNTVREVIKVLSSKGLVESKSRDGTRVRNREQWNLLDPYLIEWQEIAGGDEQDAERHRSFAEVRFALEPAAAELAARHARAEDIEKLQDAYGRMRDSLPNDIDGCCAADLEFHQAILTATRNFVFIQLSGILGAALRSVFKTTTHLARSHEAALAAHEDVIKCIRLGDTAGARNAMLGIIQISVRELRDGHRF